MKKILLDTNMFIYLEDNTITDSKVLELTKRLYDSNDYKIVIHPDTKKEINKLKDENKKKIFLSKIAVYKEIDSPPIPDDSFHKLVGCKNEHDKIDNELLFSVQRNCVSYLITNDYGLKNKSKIINLNDKVLSIDEALNHFQIIKDNEIKKPAFVQEKYLHELDLNDNFFDSLKNDYKGFKEWFEKKQLEEKKAYVSFEENNIMSFLMLKVEENEVDKTFEKPFGPGKRLKVSTMKVSDTGKRIGETFIKIITETAIKENVDEVFVTVFDKQTHLIEMLKEYGFEFYCKKSTEKSDGTIEKENVLVKNIKKTTKEYYPFINVNNKKIFIVPIQEKYHGLLFQESEKSIQLSFDDLKGLNTASNSIRKAYLCDSNIKQIEPKSILLFYSSGVKKAITCLGVVDAVFRNFNSFEELSNLVRKRTAYSQKELKKVYSDNKLVILFKYYYSFPKYVSYDFLLKNMIVKGPIQTIKQIDTINFQKIIEECKIDKEKYFINN